MTAAFDIVIPTIGRPSLERLLRSIAASSGPRPDGIILVDDRADRTTPLLVEPSRVQAAAADRIRVLPGRAAGPAAARNAGWRGARARWIAFLDDDVVVPADWLRLLAQDLDAAGPLVAGIQGQIQVPLPTGRAPTDWERNVAGLAGAVWATADMAYRRTVLAAVDGFDERFPRAYREDADLALRVLDGGWQLQRGQRTVIHPVGPAPWWTSITKQQGNIDDALMQRLHGPRWRTGAGAPAGTLRRHILATASLAAGPSLLRQRRKAARAAGAAAVAAGLAHLLGFAWSRIRPGPRTAREVAAMVVTSAAIPPVATARWVQGAVRARALVPARSSGAPVRAVLFDRDGTLVDDVPYNGDPASVRPVAGALRAVVRLRACGIAVGLVSNQSGVARGLVTEDQVRAVNERLDHLIGPFDVVAWCPHGEHDGCACRKPRPGLVQQAAAQLGVPPSHCVVIGDIGSDVQAARSAGARSILVPTVHTRLEEIDQAPHVVADLTTAVDRVLEQAR